MRNTRRKTYFFLNYIKHFTKKKILFFSALGYNKQRHDASIQADLNKLYDTRPTLGSFVSDAFSRNNVQRAATQKAAEEGGSPYFDLNHSGNVTAVLGKTALLNCRVKNIGNKTVSMLTTCS